MIPPTIWYPFLSRLNRLVASVMFGVRPVIPPPLPPSGPAIVVSDHSTLGDPLVLLATANRPLHFLMAKEIYHRRGLCWVFRAFRAIPVKRGDSAVRAIRALRQVLEQGQVVALFPEGGIDRFRKDAGYLGVAYLATKIGAPVIPVSICWEGQRPTSILGTLLVPGRVAVRYGTPLSFPTSSHPSRSVLESITKQIMDRIRQLGGY